MEDVPAIESHTPRVEDGSGAPLPREDKEISATLRETGALISSELEQTKPPQHTTDDEGSIEGRIEDAQRVLAEQPANEIPREPIRESSPRGVVVKSPLTFFALSVAQLRERELAATQTGNQKELQKAA